MTETELKAYIQAIRPADRDAMSAARRRQSQLAKPPGSLGRLEDISVQLSGITGALCPKMTNAGWRCSPPTTAWWTRAFPAPPAP